MRKSDNDVHMVPSASWTAHVGSSILGNKASTKKSSSQLSSIEHLVLLSSFSIGEKVTRKAHMIFFEIDASCMGLSRLLISDWLVIRITSAARAQYIDYWATWNFAIRYTMRHGTRGNSYFFVFETKPPILKFSAASCFIAYPIYFLMLLQSLGSSTAAKQLSPALSSVSFPVVLFQSL